MYLYPDPITEAYVRWENDFAAPFRYVEQQLVYACKLIDELEAEIERQLGPDNTIIRIDYQSGSNFVFLGFIFRPEEDLLIKMGIIIGILRETLDHMVCAMLMRNDVTIERQAFPFQKSEQKFLHRDARKRVEGLTDEQWDLISNYKPYPGQGHHFYNLHSMANTKKHRNLVTSLVGLLDMSGTVPPPGLVGVRKIDPFFWNDYGQSDLFLVIEGDPITHLEVRVGFLFNEPGIGREEVIDLLRLYAKEIETFVEAAKQINAKLPGHQKPAILLGG